MKSLPKHKQIAGLIGWIAVVSLAAATGATASLHASSFYTQLIRPEWAPPAWVFGPVWTALYTLMAIAAWLVWRVDGFRAAQPALTFFLIQLVLNALWSWFFFGWNHGALAFADILLLLVLISTTIFLFWRIKPFAGVLLAPYLAWVIFASVLNYSIWQLNPTLLSHSAAFSSP